MAGERPPLNGKRLGEEMSNRIRRTLTLLAIFGLVSLLLSCGSSSTHPSDILYVLSQGENNVGYFAIDLDKGGITLLNQTTPSDPNPTSIVLDPTGKAAYVLNPGPIPAEHANTITSYSVNSDGTLGSMVGTQIPVPNAIGMALDPSGAFLVVAS